MWIFETVMIDSMLKLQIVTFIKKKFSIFIKTITIRLQYNVRQIICGEKIKKSSAFS